MRRIAFLIHIVSGYEHKHYFRNEIEEEDNVVTTITKAALILSGFFISISILLACISFPNTLDF